MYICKTQTDFLDKRSDTRSCISRLGCVKSGGILTENSACIDKTIWLTENQKNFVDSTFFARTYDGEMKPTNVCEAKNSDFGTDRACDCPSGKYLDTTGNALACVEKPTFDVDRLELTFSYKAGEYNLEARILVGSERCESIELFIGLGEKSCVET